MSQEHVERLIGRLLTDEQFRRQAACDLARICGEEGYLLSDEELKLMLQADLVRLSSAAEALDGGIKRCCLCTG